MEYTKEINKIVEGINFVNKTVKPTKKYKKVCEYCGKEFETNRENKKYCSAACRNSYHVEKYQQKAKVKVEQETEKTIKTIPSYEVAKMMERPPWKVLNMIEGKAGEVGIAEVLRNNDFVVSEYFIESSYKVPGNTKTYKCYECTKMGCEMLANKLTGEKGILFTAKYVKRFNEMEEVINKLSQEDKAWLELKHSQQDENAQYLINVTTQKLAIEFNKTLAKEIDGEGRRITLTELADKLSQMAGFKIESINITNFLVYKGYFTKEQFPRRGSFIVNGVVIGRLERNYHRQPTEKFLTEFANKGLSLTKPADERGKIVWEFTNKFEKYFEQTFLEEFIYYVQNTEKGWE